MNENLTIALDPSSGISLQAQIRQSIVELILNHSILPGDKLPSSRMLSQQLKVSRNTVIFAYQALVDTGYLQPRERSGYVVSDDAPTTRLVDTPGAQHLDHQLSDDQLGDHLNPARQDDSVNGKIDWNTKLVQSCSYIRPVQKPVNWREYRYPFVYGQVDDELFSHSEWRDCARQA
jgi:GntR family transcriptional regulator/MocR family aminotransferase